MNDKDNIEFSIIIPNYNAKEYIEKCLESVLNQTYTNYKLIIIDDMSTDGSMETVENYVDNFRDKKIYMFKNNIKRFNGGTRNIGIDFAQRIGTDYTLFLDNDDWFTDHNCLEKIARIILKNNKPDCISLSYNCLIGENESFQSMIRNSPQELVESLYVACWTKCIKTELLQFFPENTLMEDVVQHIKQCDVLKTVVSCEKPIVCWNRNNINSCSKPENQNCQNRKWQSSMYRYAADLMDLKCNTNYCEAHRKWRLEIVLNNIKDGKYIQ